MHKSGDGAARKIVYIDRPNTEDSSQTESSEPSESILERIAAGDQLAVQACLDKYGNLVWSLARRYLGNSPDAEDAVQEIFVEIWTYAQRYKRASGSEVTFIATITRRRLIDRIRKSGRRPVIESLSNDAGGQTEPAVKSCLEEATDVQLVARILKQMDEQTREVLSMSLGDGYTHTEISDRLDLPLGTVKTRVRRGLAKIREQLQTPDVMQEAIQY